MAGLAACGGARSQGNFVARGASLNVEYPRHGTLARHRLTGFGVVGERGNGEEVHAGIAVGFWNGQQNVIDIWAESSRRMPEMPGFERDQLYRSVKKSVTKTMGWVDADVEI